MTNTAIRTKGAILNRKQRRLYEQEVIKAEKHMADVETEFYIAVFHAPKHLTYNQIYTFFLNKWEEAVEKMRKHYKFKTIIVDAEYFSDQYKPQL